MKTKTKEHIVKQLKWEDFFRALTVSKFRVKIKSLAAEAKIIRKEMAKRRWCVHTSGSMMPSMLQDHNKRVVAYEQRHTLLAYAYLRGRSYHSTENPSADNAPNAKKVSDILTSMKTPTSVSEVEAWMKAV
jgi:hypothetical protein